jgi:hypothetical protein
VLAETADAGCAAGGKVSEPFWPQAEAAADNTSIMAKDQARRPGVDTLENTSPCMQRIL